MIILFERWEFAERVCVNTMRIPTVVEREHDGVAKKLVIVDCKGQRYRERAIPSGGMT